MHKPQTPTPSPTEREGPRTRDNYTVPKQIGAASSASIERFFQFAILGLVASGYLAIAGSGYVDWPTVILAGIGLIWRAAIISGARRLQLPEIAITSATIAYMVFAPIDYLFLEQTWIAATIHVVFFVAGIKTLTARTARDYLFVAAVAFIELLAAAIFSSSGTFFLCLAAYLLCAVAARSTSELRRLSQDRFVIARTEQAKNDRGHPVSRVAVASAVMTLGILALTAGLFLILPRTANAALHFLASSRYHLTGFTSDVTLGETGKLQQDSRVVMHVRPLAVEGYSRASDLPLNLKWRGLALERFDGRRWSTDPGSFRPMPANGGLVRVAEDWQRRRRGKRILYRVEIQNIDADALFVAGAPEFVNVGQALLSRSTTGAFRFRFAPVDTLHYEVYSFLGPDIGPVEPHRVRLTAAERQADLAVPRLDPRIPELARRITSGASTDLERARLVEKYLRKIDYSLDLPADLPGNEPRDPVASFLFDWKKGYCEYFASSMAVMLRDLGIPARLVTGFQSGIQNPYSGSVVIRASDAHTWVEAFLPDAGWTVFDPTPPAASAAQQTLWTKLSLFLDAADTFWRDWVLRYDLGQQLTLASRVEAEARRIRRSGISNRTEWMAQNLAALGRWLSSAAVPIAIYVTALLLGWVAWRGTRGYAVKSRALRGHTAPPEATLFYERMLNTMKQRGYQKPGFFTPQEFASSIPQPAGDDVERFTASYYAVRFGGDGAAARDMSAALEKLSAK